MVNTMKRAISIFINVKKIDPEKVEKLTPPVVVNAEMPKNMQQEAMSLA